ncbi:MAG: CoA transferase, partial [Burkholderiales bacterium]
ASAGLSALWAYPDVDNGFSDAITIFPDHVVARLNAAAIVALLLRRDRTGRGGRVSTAQVDAIFGAMADLLLADALEPGSGVHNVGNDRRGDAFRGVFSAAGDDEWVVIDAVGDEAFEATARVIGHPELTDEPGLATASGRWAQRGRLRELFAEWARTRTPSEAAQILQEKGVPAGPMMRLDDIETDSHLLSRGAFGLLHEPQFDQPLVTNLGEARTTTLASPRLGPAPLAAEHTREVLREVLDLEDDEIQSLIDDGSLEEHAPVAPTPVAQASQTSRA